MLRVQGWTALAVAAVAAAAPGKACASGYYNMPTSMQQCLGVGFGPGYHAPLILGPAMKARIASHRVQRVAAPLSPPRNTFAEPTVWGGSGASYGQVAPFTGHTTSHPAPVSYDHRTVRPVVTTIAPPSAEVIPAPNAVAE